jgi:hypothetical protein
MTFYKWKNESTKRLVTRRELQRNYKTKIVGRYGSELLAWPKNNPKARAERYHLVECSKNQKFG